MKLYTVAHNVLFYVCIGEAGVLVDCIHGSWEDLLGQRGASCKGVMMLPVVFNSSQ